jgi:dienelactone hydrolase
MSLQTLPNPLAGYDDWADFVLARGTFEGRSPSSGALASVLGVPAPLPRPEVNSGPERSHGDLTICRLEWSVGFGPRTGAWLIRPTDAGSTRLPGVLGLHCHGGYKWLGAEQLVDLGADNPAETAALKDAWYGSRSPASELARRGYVVLVHDTFLWGTRRFPLRERSAKLEGAMAAQEALWAHRGEQPSTAERYNAAAGIHEDTVAKAAGVLGTSLAGMVAHDDLVALEILSSLEGVDATRLGCFGFSGGGGRAVLLSALSERVGAAVVTCMMATFESLTPRYLDVHSWLLNSPGLARFAEWPDLVTDAPTLVQYGLDDPLFPEEGMVAAHTALSTRGSYQGSFFPAGHVFDGAMQDEAWEFMSRTLGLSSVDTR